MYTVLNKNTIVSEMVPHIPTHKRGFASTVPLEEILGAVLYKLKIGVQWKHLPVGWLFSDKVLRWQFVYSHVNKWCKTAVFKHCCCWVQFLERRITKSWTCPAQTLMAVIRPLWVAVRKWNIKRKRRKTTNALYLSDRQGLPLSMSDPVAGNHSDLYKIEAQFEGVTVTLAQANIAVDGLFLNADAGFDGKAFREVCHSKGIVPNVCLNKRNGKSQDRDEYFDGALYNQRYSVEKINAWMDSFRSLLNRFDHNIAS